MGEVEKPKKGAIGTPTLTPLNRYLSLHKAPLGAAQGIRADARHNIVFCCDTTGSMYPFFEQARSSMSAITECIGREAPKTRFAFYAFKNHGDEGVFEGAVPYLKVPFTDRTADVLHALSLVRRGGGGDGLCAFEDVFHDLRMSITGMLAEKTSIVAIGDMPPHGVIDRADACPHNFNIREEVQLLHEHGATIYSVHCVPVGVIGSSRQSRIREFYEWMATTTGGRYLTLDDVPLLADILLGVCMKSIGQLPNFLRELKARPTLSPRTVRLLEALDE